MEEIVTIHISGRHEPEIDEMIISEMLLAGYYLDGMGIDEQNSKIEMIFAQEEDEKKQRESLKKLVNMDIDGYYIPAYIRHNIKLKPWKQE